METLFQPDFSTAHTAESRAAEAHISSSAKKNGRSWVIGVIVIYSAFALATLGIVGFTMTQKVDLVSDKYYQQEVAFQSRIDAANRAQALAEPVRWRVVEQTSGKVLELTYPQDMIQRGMQGIITLFRPSVMGVDKTFSVNVDTNGKQYIPLNGLLKGFWTISIEWQAGGVSYYKASDVQL